MMLWRHCLLLLFLLLHLPHQASPSEVREHTSPPVAVVGYLPEWRYEGANFDSMARVYTHLLLFSLEVLPDGGIGALDRIPRPTVLEKARAAARAHGMALMICFGGNGRSDGFSQMVRRPAARGRFVRSLVALCHEHGLDGVDYNWEYPGYSFGRGYHADKEVEADYAGLAALIADTREAFTASAFLSDAAPITLAYYPDGRQERLLQRTYTAGVAPSSESADLLHAMAYDTQGPEGHSSMAYGRKCLEGALSAGLPPRKVTLGLPFYGRFLHSGDWRSYEDIVQQAPQPLAASADRIAVDDHGNGNGNGGQRRKGGQEIAFNGRDTIRAKTALALSRGAGGVMVWEAGQDCRTEAVTHDDRPGTTHVVTCPEGDASSLLAAVREAIDGAGRARAIFTGHFNHTLAAAAAVAAPAAEEEEEEEENGGTADPKRTKKKLKKRRKKKRDL